MILKEAVFCWTPNRPPFDGRPTAGTIRGETVPIPRHDYGHVKTYGRTNAEWTNATNAQRKWKLQKLFTQMLHEDFIPEEAVREALSVIHDVDPQSLSAEPIEDDEHNDDD